MPTWIDMRDEADALINGDARTVPQGYWIVLRMMRVGQYSEYWNSDRHEAVGGTKWLFDDYIIRTISNPGKAYGAMPKLTEGSKTIITSGVDDVNSKIFAIEWNTEFTRLASNEDIIYEIHEYASIEPPEPPLHVDDRYNILHSIKSHGDYGRTEMMYILAERMHGES